MRRSLHSLFREREEFIERVRDSEKRSDDYDPKEMPDCVLVNPELNYKNIEKVLKYER